MYRYISGEGEQDPNAGNNHVHISNSEINRWKGQLRALLVIGATSWWMPMTSINLGYVYCDPVGLDGTFVEL